MTSPAGDPPTRRRAMLRICLGMAQTMGAMVTLTLLVLTGVNEWSIGAGIVTAGFTASSFLLFRRDGEPGQ